MTVAPLLCDVFVGHISMVKGVGESGYIYIALHGNVSIENVHLFEYRAQAQSAMPWLQLVAVVNKMH